ncbi:DUF1573 domain-containing protein [Brumimicrobium aurantiacum]|nr:DUF1573 domain-containing protein [Brumimicrobium aurantiacum]
MKRVFYALMALLTIVLTMNSCQDVSNKKTSIQIVDNHRQYYPILRGQELEVMFTIKNTGKNPFILSDLLITCGCIAPKKSSIRSIPAGKEGTLILNYDSSKNIGEVKHYIDIYGNLEKTEKSSIVFGVNVVPQSDYTKDYEELLKENIANGLHEFTDGQEHQRLYYLE